MRVCPVGAIENKPIKIGELQLGQAGEIDFVSGNLCIGNVRTPKLIEEVKEYIKKDNTTIIDVPPGTSCPVVAAIKNTDYVLLVTEPTPFGLNDLKLAVETVPLLNVPFGVIINRHGIGDNRVEKFCKEKNINVVLKLPDDRHIGESYSEGKILVEQLPEYKNIFIELSKTIGIL